MQKYIVNYRISTAQNIHEIYIRNRRRSFGRTVRYCKKLNVETGKLILACVKAQIISFDILDGIITRDKSK